MELKQCYKEIILGLIGGLIYIGIELLWRGYSHWTMFFLGGLCFVLLGQINEEIPWEMPIWQQAILGMFVITYLEFFTGCFVNLLLGWNVWDYSNVPFNFLGQICIPYMLLWIPIALVAIIFDDYLRYRMFKEEKPSYYLFKHRTM